MAEHLASETEYLDGDLRPSEIIEVLEGMKRGKTTRAIMLDAAVRDYLVRALRAGRRAA
jgi:hypothetical protein